jgi:hypothetical protein
LWGCCERGSAILGEAMKYFKQDDNKRLTWSAPIFNDAKEGASNADGIEHSCHLEKELVDRWLKKGVYFW